MLQPQPLTARKVTIVSISFHRGDVESAQPWWSRLLEGKAVAFTVLRAHQGSELLISLDEKLVAMFNYPMPDPQHGLHAVQSALTIVGFRDQSTSFPAATAGVSTGLATVGETLFNGHTRYTGLGEPVRVADYLAREAHERSCGVLMSRSTRDLLDDQGKPVCIGELDMRGGPVEAFVPVL